MNSVSLIGNIATSLSLRTTKTKKSVVSFNLAVHRLGGEETDFIPVTAWGNTAMNLAKYCDKGSKIAVSGRLKQDAYVDADGKSHSKIYVLSTKVEFLSSKPKSPDFADDFEDEIVDDELTDESVQMKDL